MCIGRRSRQRLLQKSRHCINFNVAAHGRDQAIAEFKGHLTGDSQLYGLFLTFGSSLGGSPGEQDVFKKTRFCSKSSGQIVKMCLIVKQRNIQSIGTKKCRYCLLLKSALNHTFQPKFCSTELGILNRFFRCGEGEHADEDDADAMLTCEVQEEEGDEADQAIPEDEQLTRPQLTRAQRLFSLRLAHGKPSQRDLQTAKHIP